MEQIVDDIDMVIGMDMMSKLGGLTISQGQVQFGNTSAASLEEQKKPDVVNKDFEAFSMENRGRFDTFGLRTDTLC